MPPFLNADLFSNRGTELNWPLIHICWFWDISEQLVFPGNSWVSCSTWLTVKCWCRWRVVCGGPVNFSFDAHDGAVHSIGCSPYHCSNIVTTIDMKFSIFCSCEMLAQVVCSVRWFCRALSTSRLMPMTAQCTVSSTPRTIAICFSQQHPTARLASTPCCR